MGEHVAAVTVSDEQHIIDELNRVITYVGHLLRTSVLCLLALIALQRIEDDKNQSVFYGKEGYKIIFIVAELCAVFVAQIIVLSCCLPSNSLSDIHYTILKFVGNVSAFLAPYSVVMLIVDLPHLDAYLVACVMFGIIVTCFFLDDHQQYKKPSIFMIAVSMLVPGLIFTFWISQVNSILLIHICLWVEIAYHFITYLMFIVEKTLEARKPPQQDEKNDYPRYNYLHVLRRNDETQKLIA